MQTGQGAHPLQKELAPLVGPLAVGSLTIVVAFFLGVFYPLIRARLMGAVSCAFAQAARLLYILPRYVFLLGRFGAVQRVQFGFFES